MNSKTIIKMAFIMAVFFYGVVAVAVVGAPNRDSPWLPQDRTAATLLIILGPMSVLMWGAAWAVARMKKNPNEAKQAAPPRGNWPLTRFVIAAALAESGALFGLVICFIAGDSRYAMAFAVPSAIVLSLLPTELREDGAPPHDGPPPIG